MSINLVTEQEVKALESKLKVTDKNDKEYQQIEANLAKAQETLSNQKRLIKKAGKKGYRPNPNDGNCVVTGERIAAHTGFIKQSQHNGWETYSWSVVEDEVLR